MKAVWISSVLFNFFLLLLLGWIPCTAFSATKTPFAGQAREANPFNLPRIARAHGKLSGSERFSAANAEPVAIVLDTMSSVSEVDPQFLSVTIGADHIKHDWRGITFTAPRIINMARALNPAMLRVGGTSGDYILFNDTNDHQFSHVGRSNFTMTPAEWDAVNQFVQTVGWDFIFGLNSLLRSPYPVGVWDSNNAALLMSYSNSKNYTIQWELGNEPDLWRNAITAKDHAKDFLVLKELLAQEKPLGTKIVGPDVAGSSEKNEDSEGEGEREGTGVRRGSDDQSSVVTAAMETTETREEVAGNMEPSSHQSPPRAEYFAEFIENVPDGLLHATIYHQYYGNGETGTLPEFYDVEKLDSFIHTAVYFQEAAEVLQPQADVWLGETSSLYHGGTPHLSDSYVAGFMWLDKLAIAAVVGHKRVFRQAFVGGNYALLDENQNPLPDYWLSVLYKKLVGTRVLYVLGSLEYGRYLRAYAHCAKPPYPAGSVVLLLLNMNFSSVSADLLNSELASSKRDVFWLSPPTGNLTSTAVQLNGHTLQLVNDTDLPDLIAEEQPASPSLSLPAISFGFIVFKETKGLACL